MKKNDKGEELVRAADLERSNPKESAVPKAIHEKLKEIAKREGGDYVQLKKYVLNTQRISLRKSISKDPMKEKETLIKIKSLKNVVYIPTIPSKKAIIETEHAKLRPWDYWVLEIDTKKLNINYLANWLNEEIPKQQIISIATSGSFIRHITKKSLDQIYIIYHSLDKQIKFNQNIKNVRSLEDKIKKIREDNVFDPKHITVENIIGNIPDLEFQKLLEDEESEIHEYKSSIRWGTKENRQVSHLVDQALKTIVAFLNTSGGHLVIGVDPKKKLIGIEVDQFPSADEWQLYLVDKISKKLDATYIGKYINLIMKKYDKKTVAIVKCIKIPKEEHASLDDKILVREGPRTRELTPLEVAKWTKRRIQSSP